jgi:hypothetical protein
MKKERTRKRKQKPRNHRILSFQMPTVASHFPLVHLCYTSYLCTGLLPSLLLETQGLYKASVVTIWITLEYCMFLMTYMLNTWVNQKVHGIYFVYVFVLLVARLISWVNRSRGKLESLCCRFYLEWSVASYSHGVNMVAPHAACISVQWSIIDQLNAYQSAEIH